MGARELVPSQYLRHQTGMLLRGPGRLGPSGQKQGSLGTCGGVLGFGWSTTPEVLFGGNTHVDKMPFPIESANTSSLGVTLYRSIYFLTVSIYATVLPAM